MTPNRARRYGSGFPSGSCRCCRWSRCCDPGATSGVRLAAGRRRLVFSASPCLPSPHGYAACRSPARPRLGPDHRVAGCAWQCHRARPADARPMRGAGGRLRRAGRLPQPYRDGAAWLRPR
ncbi:hypothetical protein G6F65_022300 [Rhizopus arrhizus]|uniref:Uncharacterized protein n=1 Tax=Rhizopus delemar TaxID=936053 RepID=A0A9P6XRD9_9FUNG|nr:hypothetical protein G6F65_022300 [Rhizopus arrhizus]KAG1382933.1 hypothetical protein G6F59_017822 [Rhizopus arrhizus]KAG1530801.1 hypothetical protein G6F50_017077 [Rhizopus delemar]